ncbi:MAG: serine hydrolase [Luteitalea sp.]|nr:serine hydrolase [Luteitalea sp.]
MQGQRRCTRPRKPGRPATTRGGQQSPARACSAGQAVAAALEASGTPRRSLFVIQDGDVLRHEVYGLQDRDAKRQVDERTIYHWASITKTFTAIAILQLRDRGLLALEDPIVKYVPELRHAHNPFGEMSAITIRHLLSHSSGFRDPTWGSWGGDKAWHPFEPPSWKQLDAMTWS